MGTQMKSTASIIQESPAGFPAPDEPDRRLPTAENPGSQVQSVGVFMPITSKLAFEASAEMPADFVPLVESALWGTQGALYRVRNYQKTVESLPSRLHLLLRKSGTLIASRIAIAKSLPNATGSTNAFYHSLFCVHRPEMGKGYGKLLARYTLEHLEMLLKANGLIYAYIEEGNIRSARIAASLGYQTFGHFYAHAISRLSPKFSARVGRPDGWEQHIVRKLLPERYIGHALTDFYLSFNAGEYWALYEESNPIAGVQVSPQLWQIEKTPGTTATIALNVLPRVPLLRSLFNPRAWHFLKIGNIYFQQGRPKAFFELLEHVMYRYQTKTAVMYIDERSPVYQELRTSEHFGILDPFMQTKVNVWGFLKHLSHEHISELQKGPLAISAVDV
jgi:hypothetical protein